MMGGSSRPTWLLRDSRGAAAAATTEEEEEDEDGDFPGSMTPTFAARRDFKGERCRT